MMDRLRALIAHVRTTLLCRAADSEMDEELRFHVEMEIEHNLRAGMSPAQARRKALVAFGGVERHRAKLRENRRLPFVETFWNDARIAVRYLVRDRGPSLIAVLVLALGIGLTTGMYTIVDFYLHLGSKIPDGDRLVELSRPQGNGRFLPVPLRAREYADWAERLRSLEAVGGVTTVTVNLRSGDHPVRHPGAQVSAGYTELFGSQPLLGRSFVEADEEPGTPIPVVLSFWAWEDQFDGDRGVIGRRVIVNGEPGQIVGVMDQEAGFGGVLLPLRLDRLQMPSDTGQTITLVGRLRRGVSVREANAEARAMAAELAAAYPGGNQNGNLELHRRSDRPFWALVFWYTLLATVSMVLWIACANVTNLLLVRTAVRSKDVAVRMALGASRFRTITQLMSEAGMLVIPGALLGVGVASAIVRFYLHFEILRGAPPLAAKCYPAR